MSKIKKGRGKKGGRELRKKREREGREKEGRKKGRERGGKRRKFETLGVVKDSLVPILFNCLKTGQGKD